MLGWPYGKIPNSLTLGAWDRVLNGRLVTNGTQISLFLYHLLPLPSQAKMMFQST